MRVKKFEDWEGKSADTGTESTDKKQQPKRTRKGKVRGRGRDYDEGDDDDEVEDDENEGIDKVKPLKNRAAAQKKVAQDRAEHFARPSEQMSSDASASGGAKTEATSWPGPFSVARQIAATAEQTRLKKEQKGNSNDDAKYSLTSLSDKYDKILYELFTTGHTNTKAVSTTPINPNARRIKKSAEETKQVLLNDLQSEMARGDALRVSQLSSEMRRDLAVKIAKDRELNNESLLRFAIPRLEALELPECSQVSEDFLLQAFGSIFEIPNFGSEPPIDTSTSDERPTVSSASHHLSILRLRNCGHSFSEKVANALLDHASFFATLELTGLYKLPDAALAKLLGKCSDTLLSSLDLTCNSRLGRLSMRAATSLNGLRVLVLDECTQLIDDDMLTLVSDADAGTGTGTDAKGSISHNNASPLFCTHFPLIERLSLVGLDSLTDGSIVSLLEAFGGTLRDLSLSKCKKLTNVSIFAIREHCHSLHTLDISEMNKISTAALLGLFLPNEGEADAEIERESDYCESVVFNSKKKFSSGIGSLQSVILRGNSGTSDEVVIQLAETANVSLLRLDVCNCWCLSNKALISIATNCSSLQTLDVSFCSEMDDLGLKFLAKQLQATLDSLSIWGCVTTLVGPHIIGSLPKSL